MLRHLLLNRVNIGFAKLEMLDSLSFSESVFGLGAGLFFAGYFLFEVPSNMLLQRFGANRWIARIMISWGVLSAAFAFVGTAKAFYLLRFLLGVAEAGFYPGIIFYLSCWVPSTYRGRAIAMMMSAIPLSSIVGNPLSGWIMDSMRGVAGLAGWQWMLILEATPAVLMGLAVLLYLDNSIGEAKWLDQNEKDSLEREIQRERDSQLHGVLNAASAFKDRRIWVMSLIYFCVVLGQYGVTFWMPTLVKSAGVTGNLRTGLMSAIPYIVTLAAMNLLARSADRFRERRWHMIVPVLVGALGFALVPTAPSAGVAIACTFAGSRRRNLLLGAVLVPAHGDLERRGRGRRHCHDQLGRESCGVRSAVHDWCRYRQDRQRRDWHVRDCRHPRHRGILRLADAGSHGQSIGLMHGARIQMAKTVAVLGLGSMGVSGWRSRCCGADSTLSAMMSRTPQWLDFSRAVAESPAALRRPSLVRRPWCAS